MTAEPEKESVLNTAGLVFLETGMFADSMKAYRKMSQLNPNNKFAYFGMGNVAERSVAFPPFDLWVETSLDACSGEWKGSGRGVDGEWKGGTEIIQ